MRRSRIRKRALLVVALLVLGLMPGTAGATQTDPETVPIVVQTGGRFDVADSSGQGLYWASQEPGNRTVRYQLESSGAYGRDCWAVSPSDTNLAGECGLRSEGVLYGVPGPTPTCEYFLGVGDIGHLRVGYETFEVTGLWFDALDPKPSAIGVLAPWAPLTWTFQVGGTYLRGGHTRSYTGVLTLQGGSHATCSSQMGAKSFNMYAELTFL